MTNDGFYYYLSVRKQAGHYKFEAIFTPQPEGGFTVEVPDLPGCVSEGDNLEEAEKNIQEAIGLYLETLEERGIPLPQRESSKMFKMNITGPSRQFCGMGKSVLKIYGNLIFRQHRHARDL